MVTHQARQSIAPERKDAFRDVSPEFFPEAQKLSLAMAYVMWQDGIGKVYPPEEGLDRGTIFPELDKPFLGARRGGRQV